MHEYSRFYAYSQKDTSFSFPRRAAGKLRKKRRYFLLAELLRPETVKRHIPEKYKVIAFPVFLKINDIF